MKKVFALLLTSLVITSFVACGDSNAERVKDSLYLDSLKKATESSVDDMIDSMNQANEAVSASSDSTGSKDSIK